MSKIAKNLTDLIGNIPLLELSNYNRLYKIKATLVAKLEFQSCRKCQGQKWIFHD